MIVPVVTSANVDRSDAAREGGASLPQRPR